MSSIDEANRFVNCVMNRYRSDTVMRVGAALLVILIPVLVAFIGLAVKSDDAEYNLIFNYLVPIALIIMVYTMTLTLYLVYRRMLDHSARDIVWRSALIGYAGSYGCDTSALEEIDRKARSKDKSRVEIIAIGLIIVFFIMFMAMVVNPRLFGFDSADQNYLYVLLGAGMIIMFLLSITVFLFVIKFPYRHESLQIEFTEELARQLSMKGIMIEPMRPAVKRKRVIVTIILMLITVYIYTVFVIRSIYLESNIHIQNQWSYENRLMDMIIKNEGGTGVAEGYAVEGGR